MGPDISRLNATEEIKALKARYCRCLDIRDWAGLRMLFADGATFAFHDSPSVDGTPPQVQKVTGADVFVSSSREALANAVTVHHCHMPEIEITSDRSARGIWAMEDIIETPEQIFHGYGHYHEHYERIEGAWRIAKLELTRLKFVVTPREIRKG